MSFFSGAFLHASQLGSKPHEICHHLKKQRTLQRWAWHPIRRKSEFLTLIFRIKISYFRSKTSWLTYDGQDTKRNNGWIKYLTLPEAAGKLGRGEPRKLWKETVTEEFQFWKLDADNLHDRPKWKKSLKIAMKCPILGNQGLLFHNGRYWTING